MSSVDWAAVAHEVMNRINNMTSEEWEVTMDKYRYVPTEDDLRCERVNKMFAHAIVCAIDKGDIETEDICEALGAPLPSIYNSEIESDDAITELDREIKLIHSALDEYFQEIFGMRMEEAW